jgi:hypothetical protein
MGRLATVRALLAYFREDLAFNTSAQISVAEKPRPIRSLIDLNFLRVVVVLSTILAFVGTAILASFVSTKVNPRPGLSLILFLAMASLIGMAGWALNWWLSLAAIFAVRNGKDALASIAAAVAFSRDHIGPVLAVSTWTALAHLVAFSMATTAVSFPLALLRVASARIVMAGIILVTLAYFAIADWLYMVRLTGYVCIAEMPDGVRATSPVAPAMPLVNSTPIETSIDRDEPILSDLPKLAVET